MTLFASYLLACGVVVPIWLTVDLIKIIKERSKKNESNT